MKTLIDTKGSNMRQTKINDGRLLMKYQFNTDPSYRDGFYFWEFGVNEDCFDNIPIKVFGEKYSAANGLTIQFNTLYDSPIVIGDMLWDKETGLYWICVESFNRDGILYSGKLVRCVNNKMRWQNSSGQICEYPVFEINSTQYNSGESGNKTITLGSSQHLITIVADKNTIALNHGQRFFWDRNTIEPTVFKVTQNDTTASNYDKGLLKITVTEDQYNPDTDSIDEWICDYYSVAPETVTILYSGNPTIRVGGTKTLKVDTTETVVWTVDGEIGATITPNGNSVKVKCPNDADFINKTITVTAEINDIKGDCELTVTGGV